MYVTELGRVYHLNPENRECSCLEFRTFGTCRHIPILVGKEQSVVDFDLELVDELSVFFGGGMWWQVDSQFGQLEWELVPKNRTSSLGGYSVLVQPSSIPATTIEELLRNYCSKLEVLNLLGCMLHCTWDKTPLTFYILPRETE